MKSALGVYHSRLAMDDLQEFEAYLVQKNLAPITVKGYVKDARQFLAWLQERQLSLDQFSAKHADDFLDFLVAGPHQIRHGVCGPYSPRTVRKKIAVLKIFFSYLDTQK